MATISLKVQNQFCAECSLALRRFIGNMDGVESIEVGEGSIDIAFDGSKIGEERLRELSRDSVEKLGYKVIEDL